MHRKVALITGASRGIGAACAAVFAEDGWDLVLADSRADELAAVGRSAAANQADVLTVPTDLAREAEIDRLFEQAVGRFRRLDVLINNAAVQAFINFPEMPRKEWHRVLAINLHAPVFCAQLAVRQMARQKSGVIINISSINEKQSTGVGAPYVAAKGALQAITRELAVRHGGDGIRAITVSPGDIDTGITDTWTDDAVRWVNHFLDMTPLNRRGKPRDVADVVLFLCSDKASYITGTEVIIDGGRLAALYPGSLRQTWS